MTSWWEVLGDDELRARLEQRGLPQAVVDRLVAGRETHEARRLLDEVLE